MQNAAGERYILPKVASCPIVLPVFQVVPKCCPDSCQVNMPDLNKNLMARGWFVWLYELFSELTISAIQWHPSHLKTDVSLGEENKALSTQLCSTPSFDQKGGFPSL